MVVLQAKENYLYIHKTDRTAYGSTVYCPSETEAAKFEELPYSDAIALYEAEMKRREEEAEKEQEPLTDEDYAEAGKILLGEVEQNEE
jgi:hypothetical protein